MDDYALAADGPPGVDGHHRPWQWGEAGRVALFSLGHSALPVGHHPHQLPLHRPVLLRGRLRVVLLQRQMGRLL